MKLFRNDTQGYVATSNLNGSLGGTVEVFYRTTPPPSAHPAYQGRWYLITMRFHQDNLSFDGSDWSDYGLSRTLTVTPVGNPASIEKLEVCQLDLQILEMILDMEKGHDVQRKIDDDFQNAVREVYCPHCNGPCREG